MKIIRLLYYSIFFIIFAVIGIAYTILLNDGMFERDDSPRVFNIVRGEDFTPLPPTNGPISTSERPNNSSFVTVLADLNQVRQAAGAPTLSLNPKLGAAAAVQARFNANQGFLSHEGVRGELVQHRVEDQGYRWGSVAENLLSRWDIDGHQVFKQWQGSPGHNANMMNPKYTQIGLAYMITNQGEVYYAMVLASPR